MPEVHLVCSETSDGEGAAPVAPVAITRFPCVVGRHSACDRRINHPQISRRHCAFSWRDGRVWVEDLGSLNGTRLNGVPLTDPRPLKDGDRLDLADLAYEVRLPGQPAGAAPETAPAGAAGPAGQPGQVLVVEDDEDAAQTLALLLRAWGYEVRVARDGPQALRSAGARQPDTVLLDIGLPGMDGYEVARRLRAQAGLGKAWLVGITGDERAQDPSRVGEGGLQHLLIKPVDPQLLRAALLDRPR
jgi:CheY-like chemotaxis protein